MTAMILYSTSFLKRKKTSESEIFCWVSGGRIYAIHLRDAFLSSIPAISEYRGQSNRYVLDTYKSDFAGVTPISILLGRVLVVFMKTYAAIDPGGFVAMNPTVVYIVMKDGFRHHGGGHLFGTEYGDCEICIQADCFTLRHLNLAPLAQNRR